MRPGLLAALVLAAVPAFAQGTGNPIARNPNTLPDNLLAGVWNGANLEKRSNCSASQNNGAHGTYAEYDITFDRVNLTMGINETAITGLTCVYVGPYSDTPIPPRWTGNYSCSDGKTGSFSMQQVLASANSMSLHLAIKLTGNESCDVDAILGGSRF
jgi:hypothetical protein